MTTRLSFATGVIPRAGQDGLSIGEETRRCIAQVEAGLAAQGARMADLLKAVIYLEPGAHAQVWEAWDNVFAGAPARPLRLTQVAGLAPDVRVMIDAIAQTHEEEKA